MENLAAKMFQTYMEEMKTPCTVIAENEDETVLRIGWQLDNTKVSVFFIFGSDGRHVQIRGHEFMVFPEAKKELMYKVCNDINSQYRWLKFYVSEDRHEVVAQDDAVIQLDSCAEEVLELMLRMNNIIDEVYPIFMKALYA